jgi:hypothetical protein
MQNLGDTPLRATPIDRRYSVVLLGVGLFYLLGGVFLAGSGAQSNAQDLAATRFAANNVLLVGASSLVAAFVRWLRVPIYLPVTVAVSIFLLVGFPVGTFAFLYWFTKVRPQELQYGSVSERRSFLYTAGLYTAGLALGLPVLLFRWLANTSPPDSPNLWNIFTLFFLGIALLLLVVGVLRGLRLPISYYVTLVLNVLLVIYFPVGTCFALIWFFAVRKHDRMIYERA